ncbi:MAG: hypothetical protein QOJ82_1987 [Solirubrobacteraceae bacterium]|nr:hypothetical protein [Solirubrobacteraceae bacterium]
MSVVRSEFGPTLPELLGPRVRALPRLGRLGLALASAAVVALLAWLLIVRPEQGLDTVVVRGPVTFNLVYSSDAMHRTPPRAGELLRLRTRSGPPSSMTVRALRLAPYRGDVTAALTLLSVGMIDRMRHQYPGFVYRSDGRANVNGQPGYQIVFQAPIGGHTTYGKRILLVSATDPSPRVAADITLLAQRSSVVPKADAVGGNGVLKAPLKTLTFGTSQP